MLDPTNQFCPYSVISLGYFLTLDKIKDDGLDIFIRRYRKSDISECLVINYKCR